MQKSTTMLSRHGKQVFLFQEYTFSLFSQFNTDGMNEIIFHRLGSYNFPPGVKVGNSGLLKHFSFQSLRTAASRATYERATDGYG